MKISDSWLFQHLSEADKTRLADLSQPRRYSNNQLIFSRGDTADFMLVVLSGKVKIMNFADNGKEVMFRIMNPGDVFGEIGVLDGGERSADARASGKTEVQMLSRDDLLPFLRKSPELCLGLINVLCERLRNTSAQLEDFAFLDLKTRLGKMLVHLAEQKVGNSEAVTGTTVTASQQELAAMMGTTREAVNKRLREWENEGAVSLGRGEITLHQPGALKAET